MQEQFQKVFEELRGSWRFRWHAVVAAWAVAIVAWIYVMTVPSVYEARAKVFVDSATALKPLLQGLAAQTDVQAQVDMVRQAMLSQPQLERVAEETGLAANADTPEAREALLAGLAASISIELDAASAARQRNRRELTEATYILTFRHGDREKALAVVDTLLRNLITDTVGNQVSGSQDAQQFLEQQLKDYEKRLFDAETRLAKFKKANIGLMPTESGDYFQRVQTVRDELDTARAALRRAVASRDAIRSQLRGEQPFRVGGSTQTSAGLPAQNDVDTRIREAQARLDDLLLRFTERHPEVIATRRTLEELQQRRTQELAALSRGEAGTGLATRESNPVFQSLQIKLNEAEVQVAAIQSDMADRQRTLNELNGRLSVAPEVEAELARLNRDYGVTKTQYDALLARYESAKITEQADRSGAMRFDITEPPTAPLEPVAPNRGLLFLLAFFGAIVVGGGVAYVQHRLRPVFTNPRTLAEVTGLRVLGSVSLTERMGAQAEQAQDTRQIATALLALAGLCVLVLIANSGAFGFILQWFT
jgi:polysaccharide chain length determinant protein (PEP-CTERM system associated)